MATNKNSWSFNEKKFDANSYIAKQKKRINDLDLKTLGNVVVVTSDKIKFKQEINKSSTNYSEYLLKFIGEIGNIIRVDKNCNEVKVRFNSDDIWLPLSILKKNDSCKPKQSIASQIRNNNKYKDERYYHLSPIRKPRKRFLNTTQVFDSIEEDEDEECDLTKTNHHLKLPSI